MDRKGNTIFWAVIACLLWSTAYAGIKLGLQFDRPFHFAGIRFMISGMILLPFTVSPLSYLRMVRQYRKVSFLAAAAFSIWFNLLPRPGVRVSELNLWKFIIPVAGAILSWLLVPGEKPEWITITGMVIITGPLIMFFSNTRRSHS